MTVWCFGGGCSSSYKKSSWLLPCHQVLTAAWQLEEVSNYPSTKEMDVTGTFQCPRYSHVTRQTMEWRRMSHFKHVIGWYASKNILNKTSLAIACAECCIRSPKMLLNLGVIKPPSRLQVLMSEIDNPNWWKPSCFPLSWNTDLVGKSKLKNYI